MGILITVSLILLAVALLFLARTHGALIQNLANIAAIVATIVALVTFLYYSVPPLASVPATPTNVASAGTIPFASPNDPKALNPNLQWERGQSSLSNYTLSPGMIELVAGPSSWPGIPTLSYRYPIKGGFDAQIGIVFNSFAPKLDASAHVAGLMVRPTGARLVAGDETFPQDWLVNIRAVSDAGHSIGCRGGLGDYPSTMAFLRIERANNRWRCAYSENGENWNWAAPRLDEVKLFDQEVQVAVFAYSTNTESIKVQFKDWALSPK